MDNDTSLTEYETLKNALTNLNVYEENMELDEMRELMLVMQMSMLANDDFKDDPEVNNFQELLSSTLLDLQQTNEYRSYANTMSPLSSPEYEMQTFIVQADVHHELNWSPPAKTAAENPRKRTATRPLSPEACLAGPTAPKRALLSNTYNNPADSGCSTCPTNNSSNGNYSRSSSVSVVSSNSHEGETTETLSSSSEEYAADASSCLNYVVNMENMAASQHSTQSENIDLDLDNLSQFSN